MEFDSSTKVLDTGDSFDLPPQPVGGVVVQLAVNALHLNGPFEGPGEAPFGWQQGPMQRDDQRL
jgi:hypothetical protein